MKGMGECCGRGMRFEIFQKRCTTTKVPVRYRMKQKRFYGFGR